MRIAVLGLRGIPNVQGGVETHCEHLFTNIASRGHEVIVFCRESYVTPPSHVQGVKLISFSCPRQKYLEAVVHTFIGVFKAWRLHPDILHIHAIGPSLFVPLARALGMRVVCTNHGADYERRKWGSVARLILRVGENLGSRFSNAVIAISPSIAEQLRTSYRCVVDVIPNGVIVRPRSSRDDIVLKSGLQKGKYILAVARLVPEKSLDLLMDAYEMAGLPLDWKLVIVGEADHSSSYSRSLVARGASSAGVVMTGSLHGEPLAELYSHAGLFVLPSHHEGLPIVLLEALSYGLSVIASDIPAHRALNLPEERLFRKGDPRSAAEKLRYFIDHPQTPEDQVEQIKRTANRFDWNLIAQKTLEVYRRVLRP